MSLLQAKHVHCIGVKGAGMTALAELLVKRGVTVTGSDTDEVFFTDKILHRLGVEIHEGFSLANIPNTADLIVYSTAYTPEKNEELKEAFSSGKTVLSYPEALGQLTQDKMTFAICGTHGKTTTSALLAHVLKELGHDPSAIIGSEITNWGGNALAGNGSFLVIEADEYQNKLRLYHPFGVILTSADWDHPDFFPTFDAYLRVFQQFVERIPRHGFLVACGDSAAVLTLSKQCGASVLTYGFHAANDLRVINYTTIDPESKDGKEGSRSSFSVLFHEKEELGPFRLKLSGRHNASNAAAVIALMLQMKFPLHGLAEALGSFRGTKRRFERIGEYRGAIVYDDYAHHPDEVRVTLRAFRELYPKRNLHVVFHPHTFTRTKGLFEEFTAAFEDANSVTLLDIYGSAREVQGGVSSEELVQAINRYTPGKAFYASDRGILVENLRQTLGKEDLFVTMGAGDVWQIGESLIRKKL